MFKHEQLFKLKKFCFNLNDWYNKGTFLLKGEFKVSDKTIQLIKYINTDFKGHLRAELKSKEIPIKTKHAGLFSILYEKDEKIEFKNLVKIWKKSKSTLSETINRYVKSGLLKKEYTELDKRVVYISLTDLGETYSKDFKEIYNSYCSSIAGSLGKKDKEELNRLLEMVVDSIEEKK